VHSSRIRQQEQHQQQQHHRVAKEEDAAGISSGISTRKGAQTRPSLSVPPEAANGSSTDTSNATITAMKNSIIMSSGLNPHNQDGGDWSHYDPLDNDQDDDDGAEDGNKNTNGIGGENDSNDVTQKKNINHADAMRTSKPISTKGSTTSTATGAMNATLRRASCSATTSPMTPHDIMMTESSASDRYEDATQYFPPIPPQLHPAVSMGVRRVSSCYFSIGSADSINEKMADEIGMNAAARHNSTASLQDFIIALQQSPEHQDDDDEQSLHSTLSSNHSTIAPTDTALYHDILMSVFTYLDASSLAAFSETARRPNFEVFYYLQLQLQRSLLVEQRQTTRPEQNETTESTTTESTTTETTAPPSTIAADTSIAGTSYIARLATIDQQTAQKVVTEFLESNNTLDTMPLSHSLAYIRHALRAATTSSSSTSSSSTSSSSSSQSNNHNRSTTTAAVAFIAAFAGAAAAAFMTSTDISPSMMTTMMHHHHLDSEIPNMLFGVGFVGSLMSAASSQMKRQQQKQSSSENKKQFPRLELSTKSMRQLYNALQRENKDGSMMSKMSMLLQIMNQQHQQSQQRDNETNVLLTPNPYDHMVDGSDETASCDQLNATTTSNNNNNQTGTNVTNEHTPSPSNVTNNNTTNTIRKKPSGCVGAYSRAIHNAATQIKNTIKSKRAAAFDAMSDDEKLQQTSALLDACTSDQHLDMVKAMVGSSNLDGFYVSNDGSETCALHTAALHGSIEILKFLCHGIIDDTANYDGGLCDVNITDANGWTAMHFAAGTNSTEAVMVLAQHGAKLNVEANNGYTPLSWAQRLSNDAVADVLKKLIHDAAAAAAKSDTGSMMRHKPFTMLAHKFFSMIPTAS